MPAKPVDDLVGLSIEEIAERRGVGVRQAYALYQRANRPADVPVTSPQKQAILTALDHGGAATVAELQEKAKVLGGVYLDAHSLTHVVWSLQKQRLVRFRERKNRDAGSASALTAIKLTPTGAAALMTLRNGVHADAVIVAATPEVTQPGPTLVAYPRLVDLLERASRAALVRQAVKLLEQAGEDEVSLELLERHTLTDVEEQMVGLLASLEVGNGHA